MPQATNPTLMQWLRAKYQEHLAKLTGVAKQQAATADGFFAFCEDLLNANPPVQIFYPPSGIGCITAKGERFVFNRASQQGSAGVNKPGAMPPDNSVGITSGDGIGDGLPEGGIGL